MWSQLAASFQHGNPYILTMLVLAFIGTTICFERLIMLLMVYHLDFQKFLGNIKKTIHAQDYERAMSLCKSASRTSVPYIGLKALEAAERDPGTVRGVIEEETICFLPKIEARLSALPAFGTLILLIGVLGSLDGLWGSFDSIAVLDTSEKQARLAHGIAGALNPTAFGLLICLLFVGAHYTLRSIALKLTEKVHWGVTVLSNLLVPSEYGAVMAAPVAMAPMAAMPDSSGDSVGAIPAAEPAPGGSDDSFDDATVEDIKDEEEII